MTEQVLVVSGLAPGIGGMDSGCQGWLTAHAMRTHLGWNTHSLVFGESYLRYPTDWVFEKTVSSKTIMDFAKDCTMFVFMDSVVNIPRLPLGQFLTPSNHCIVGVGTGLRHNVDHVLMDQIKQGIPVIVPPQDETTVNRVIGIPFDFVIVDIDEIDSITKGIEKNDEFTVCHAYTHGGMTKGGKIVNQIISEFPDIRFESISDMSWRDAIRAKSRCHAIIDDLVLPTYGLNVLESGILQQHAISNVGPWCYMIYPDFPFSSVNESVNSGSSGLSMVDSIRDQLVALSEFPDMWEHKLPAADQWVRDHNSSNVVAEKWRWFAKWLKN